MGKTITIDPITRLEGHGRISIFLDDRGEVERALLQVPELRGFEAFCVGRPAEDMPQITSRICGVCPTAHHMASTKALDALYGAAPTPAARAIRETFFHLFTFEDHLLHFYFLGGPDFVMGPRAQPAVRNVLGVISKVGLETGRKVIAIRERGRHLMATIGGKPIHPVLGLPGGVAKAVTEETRQEIRAYARDAVAFARFTLQVFEDVVLKNREYTDLILSDTFRDPTNYMGMVDARNRVDLYDGKVRVVDTEGRQLELFAPQDYASVIGEHVEPWSYIKFPFLRKLGWKGFVSGPGTSLVRVAPLARLNAAEGLSTPQAQEECGRMFATLGRKPVHNTLALHWARLVEVLHAAEKLMELAEREELTSPEIRNLDLKTPTEGVGIVEAPRGTLIHHYVTDGRGVITAANLIVATLFNSAPICMSVEKAARGLIHGGKVDDGILNMVEMAFRAYDPCLSCATHHQPGRMPLRLELRGPDGRGRGVIRRDRDGRQVVLPVDESPEQEVSHG